MIFTWIIVELMAFKKKKAQGGRKKRRGHDWLMLHMSLITFPLLFILISAISLCFPGQLDSLTHDENKYCMWETLSCHLGREEQRGERGGGREGGGGVCAVFAAATLCLLLSQLSHLDAPSAPTHHDHHHHQHHHRCCYGLSNLQLLTLAPLLSPSSSPSPSASHHG